MVRLQPFSLTKLHSLYHNANTQGVCICNELPKLKYKMKYYNVITFYALQSTLAYKWFEQLFGCFRQHVIEYETDNHPHYMSRKNQAFNEIYCFFLLFTVYCINKMVLGLALIGDSCFIFSLCTKKIIETFSSESYTRVMYPSL